MRHRLNLPLSLPSSRRSLPHSLSHPDRRLPEHPGRPARRPRLLRAAFPPHAGAPSSLLAPPCSSSSSLALPRRPWRGGRAPPARSPPSSLALRWRPWRGGLELRHGARVAGARDCCGGGGREVRGVPANARHGGGREVRGGPADARRSRPCRSRRPRPRQRASSSSAGCWDSAAAAEAPGGSSRRRPSRQPPAASFTATAAR